MKNNIKQTNNINNKLETKSNDYTLKNLLSSWSNNSDANKQRVGRGIGSGMGKTCTRGHKGQGARTGRVRAGFEGGQTPTYRRLPKFGQGLSTNRRVKKLYTINARDIEKKVQSSDTKAVDKKTLKKIFRIPYYYKRIKVVGKNKKNFGFNKTENL